MNRVERVCSEIRGSEGSYISRLTVLVRGIARPALDRRIIDGATHERVFSCVESLIPLHERILEQLEAARTPAEHAQPFVDAWDEVAVRYARFATRDDAFGDETLERLMRENAPFKALCDAVRASHPENIMIQGLLKWPFSRLPRYRLLFRDLSLAMGPAHVDQPVVAHLLHLLDEVMDSINEKRRVISCRLEFLRLVEAFGPVIVSPTRVLIDTFCVDMLLSGGGAAVVRLALFNDAVLLCKAVSRKRLELVEFGLLADMQLRAGARPTVLELVGRSEVHQLRVSHQRDCDMLMELFQQHGQRD